MSITDYHAKYLAYELTRRRPSDDTEKLAGAVAVAGAQVDLNPHQIDTTAHLSHEQLQQLSDEVGSERTLLVVCSAFRGAKSGYANLTVKKIPRAVLSRCEWGKDDYSLNVENLPKALLKPGQIDFFDGEGGGSS